MSLQNKENKITKPEVEEFNPTSITDTDTTITDAINTADSVAESKPVQTPQVQEAITQVVNNAVLNATEPVASTTTEPIALTTTENGPVKTLKDAFPNLDTEIIESILQSHGGNVDATFETLLGMSDPNYKPEENPVQHQNQMRDDEAFARQLVADEANNQQQPQSQNNTDNEPLFNFQEDLPAIKEKVIEVGTAAKNKIMSFYNQLVSGESMSAGNAMTENNNANQSNTLERDLGNLNISDNQNTQRSLPPHPPHPPQQRGSVDLYEWNGQPAAKTNPPPPLQTSTSNDQLLADEEFARQLAREDAEVAAAIADSAEVVATAPQATSPPIESSTSPLAPSTLPSHPINTNINVGPLKSGRFKLAKDSDNSSNQEEVTFTELENNDKDTKGGFTIDNGEDDDLDDLFIRDDAYAKSKSDTKSESKPENK